MKEKVAVSGKRKEKMGKRARRNRQPQINRRKWEQLKKNIGRAQNKERNKGKNKKKKEKRKEKAVGEKTMKKEERKNGREELKKILTDLKTGRKIEEKEKEKRKSITREKITTKRRKGKEKQMVESKTE